MRHSDDIWAVIPVKELGTAKQRLAPALSGAHRQALMLAMLEDVLAALAASRGLAGLMLVTVEPQAVQLGRRYGAEIRGDGARDGHTGAVAAAARQLAAQGSGMLALPADLPLLEAEDVAALLTAHRESRGFTIVPSRDEHGSNAVLCSPADVVPLRFGEDSFFPHLAAARSRGIEPVVLRLPRIGLDIDGPEDLEAFRRVPSASRARALLADWERAGRETVTP